MNFLKRLLAKPKPAPVLTDRLWGPGAFDINVVALSNKSLDAFWKATSNQWQRNDGDRHLYQNQTDARIVSDVENRAPHAMRVEIAGKVVGHLGHSDALKLHRRLTELRYSEINSICRAAIVGRCGHWDVKLDLDPQLSDTRTAPSDANR